MLDTTGSTAGGMDGGGFAVVNDAERDMVVTAGGAVVCVAAVGDVEAVVIVVCVVTATGVVAAVVGLGVVATVATFFVGDTALSLLIVGF